MLKDTKQPPPPPQYFNGSDIIEASEILAEAIRKGFSDLGDRISQGTNPENVAMSLKMIADKLPEEEG